MRRASADRSAWLPSCRTATPPRTNASADRERAAPARIQREHDQRAERHVAEHVRDDVERRQILRQRIGEIGERAEAERTPAGKRIQRTVDDQHRIQQRALPRKRRRPALPVLSPSRSASVPGAGGAPKSLRGDQRLHAEPGGDLRDQVVAGGGERLRAAGGVGGTGRRALRDERALADHLAVLRQRRARGHRGRGFATGCRRPVRTRSDRPSAPARRHRRRPSARCRAKRARRADAA